MFGPITILKVKATVCPCISSTHETSANQALTILSNLPIKFSTSSSSDNSNTSSSKGVGKFVTNLFKSATAVVTASGDGGYTKGKLNIVDSIRGPILSFVPEGNKNYDDGNDNDNNDDGNDSNDDEKKMTIRLKQVGHIEPHDDYSSSNGGIIIYKKTKNEHEKVELIRFIIRSLNPFDNENVDSINAPDASTEERDDIIEHLRIVIEWDRERRKAQPNDDDNDDGDDDDGEQKSGLGQKALKAKYFIQKEIELKKQSKDRESRKAKYMKESGGLKYTALAMANREMS